MFRLRAQLYLNELSFIKSIQVIGMEKLVGISNSMPDPFVRIGLRKYSLIS